MAIKKSPVVADRVQPSPVLQSSLIPSNLEAIGRSGGANRPSPATATPLTVAQIMQRQGATPGEANRFANMPGAPSMARLQEKAGATPGEANRFATIAAAAAAKRTGTTPTGAVVTSPVPAGGVPVSGGASGGATGGGATGGGDQGDGGAAGSGEEATEQEKVDVASMLSALINQLLEGDWLGFQGERASELRRLQNLRNQLYGDTEMGTIGAIQRQQQLDTAARRRLAAARAVSGMLGGGAYAGTRRGVGTIQRADQDFAIQELERPFKEQTASDRLREFGLTYTPTNRVFDLYNFNRPEDIMGGWAAETWSGRQAASRARLAALEQLRQRGMQL